MAGWQTVTVAILALTLGARAEVAVATEQVPYTVERTLESGVEIRRYGDTVIAETVIDAGTYADAGNEGFRRLAGYIFGGNQKKQKIAMTAPVAMAPAEEGQRIAMTAPVAAARDSGGGWRIAFYMPAEYTLETLPTPRDPRVTLRTVPGRLVAALRFSGRGTDEQFAEHTNELAQALAGAGIESVGAPWTARYNAPWVLPLLRRNEAMIEVVAARM
jgi:hypothetical protein